MKAHTFKLALSLKWAPRLELRLVKFRSISLSGPAAQGGTYISVGNCLFVAPIAKSTQLDTHFLTKAGVMPGFGTVPSSLRSIPHAGNPHEAELPSDGLITSAVAPW